VYILSAFLDPFLDRRIGFRTGCLSYRLVVPFCSAIYTKAAPTLNLRWRYTAGRHAAWRTVQAAIVRLPRPIQAVYARLNGEAVKLNERATSLRRRLRQIVRGGEPGR
jgi:hypothetical protein